MRNRSEAVGQARVDRDPAGGWIEVVASVRPPGEVVVSTHPVRVFADTPVCEAARLRGELRGRWRQALRIDTPGTNRQVTVFGALEATTGRWVYRPGRRCAADFVALLQTLTEAFPRASAIVVICDNDSIHHAKAVTAFLDAFLDAHPRLEVWCGARYSPHDNPVERIWVVLKNHLANTAVSWTGRLRQVHASFRARSPDQLLATAAPWASPWLPPGYKQNLWNAA